MQLKPVLLAVAATVLLSACQTPSYHLAPKLAPDQTATLVQGRPSVNSVKPLGAAQVTLLTETGSEQVQLLLAVRNQGRTSADFGIENVSASDGAGQPVHVYTYDELANAARQQAAADQVAAYRDAATHTNAAYAGTVQSYDAADPNSYTSQYGYGQDSSHAMPAHGSDEEALNYNAEAVRHQVERSARYRRQVAEIEKHLAETIRKLGGTILRDGQVAPGDSAGGVIVLERPEDAQALAVAVSLNGEVHNFTFDVKKVD